VRTSGATSDGFGSRFRLLSHLRLGCAVAARQICRSALAVALCIGHYALVLTQEELTQSGGRDRWVFVSGCLAIASILVIVSGIVNVFGFQGVSVRDRVFSASESAGAFPALLAVGAVAMIRARGTASRWPVSLARAGSVIVIIATAYGLWYSLVVRTDFPAPSASPSYVAFVTENWAYRLSGVLRFVVAGVLAVGALALPAGTPRAGDVESQLSP